MRISEKIKTFDNKIEQNKARYDLDRPTAKISALSSGNISKYEFLSGKDVLPESDLLEKDATLKRFEFSPLGKELKAQTDSAKRKYKKLDKTFEFDKIIKKEKPTVKKYNRSNLIYDSKYSFYPYYNIKNFNNLSFTSKYPILFSFYSELNKFYYINPRKGRTKENKKPVYDKASELYNEYLEIFFNQYMTLSDANKRKLGDKYDPEKLFLEGYDYSVWSENKEESTDKEESTGID